MKTVFTLWVLTFLCAGCQVSRQGPSITAEQAMTTAVQLANDKCDALYQKHPFQAAHLPQFTGGRWIWTDVQGVGLVDMEAKVELASDGSTNRVDIKLLDNRLSLRAIPMLP